MKCVKDWLTRGNCEGNMNTKLIRVLRSPAIKILSELCQAPELGLTQLLSEVPRSPEWEKKNATHKCAVVLANTTAFAAHPWKSNISKTDTGSSKRKDFKWILLDNEIFKPETQMEKEGFHFRLETGWDSMDNLRSGTWCFRAVILALRIQRQEDQEFEIILGYVVTPRPAKATRDHVSKYSGRLKTNNWEEWKAEMLIYLLNPWLG